MSVISNLDEMHKFRFLCQANLIGGIVWLVWGGIIAYFFPDISDSPLHRLPGALPPLLSVALVYFVPWAKRRFEIVLAFPITLLTFNAIHLQFVNGFPPSQAVAIPALFGLSIYGFFNRGLLAIHTILSVSALVLAMHLHGWDVSMFIHFLNSITLLGIGFLFVSHRLRILNSAETAAKRLADETLKNSELITAASQVAHDIRSPIMALRTLRDVLPLPEDAKGVLDGSIKRVEDVAADLLDELRIQKQPLQPLRGNQIAKLAADLVDEKHARVTALGVTVRIEPELSGLATVFLSEVRLKRTLSNLIENALDALEGRQTPNKALSIRVFESVENLCIQVSDTGAGIAADVLPLLTERGASFGKPKGNGLGLWAAKLFAEGHGGSLRVQSTVGEGTSVSLHFPTGSGR